MKTALTAILGFGGIILIFIISGVYIFKNNQKKYVPYKSPKLQAIPPPASLPASGPWDCVDINSFNTRTRESIIKQITSPVRKNYKGDIECLSYDGNKCFYANDIRACKALAVSNPPNVKSIVCTDYINNDLCKSAKEYI